jgi:Ca2+/Na+ antiporter
MWIEILLWIFITLYGLAGLGTFAAYIPQLYKSDDAFIQSNIRDYLFRLLTSIIFFLYAIFIVHNWYITRLLLVELVGLLIAFVWLVYKKKREIIQRIKKLTHHTHKYF